MRTCVFHAWDWSPPCEVGSPLDCNFSPPQFHGSFLCFVHLPVSSKPPPAFQKLLHVSGLRMELSREMLLVFLYDNAPVICPGKGDIHLNSSDTLQWDFNLQEFLTKICKFILGPHPRVASQLTPEQVISGIQDTTPLRGWELKEKRKTVVSREKESQRRP